jgi:hypothetical protein
MFDLRGIGRRLGFSVGDSQAMVEELVMESLNCDVSKTVNRRGKNCSSVNLEVFGEIGSTTQETDP